MFPTTATTATETATLKAPSSTSSTSRNGNLKKKTHSEQYSTLSQLLYEKEYLTMSELEDLRKAIESQQQIQMAMKNSNPTRVQIQCRHFKSKKCTFQITFKATVIGDSSASMCLPASSAACSHSEAERLQPVSSFSMTTTSAYSSSIFSGISQDSSVASAQFDMKEGAASTQDIMRTSLTGRREESFPASSARSVILQMEAENQLNNDASCSPSVVVGELVKEEAYCKEPVAPLQSLRCSHGQPELGNYLSMSSWQQSNPPVTMLLQNFDASATMGEREKREVRSNNNNIIINIDNHHNYSATRSSTTRALQPGQLQLLDTDRESSSSHDESSFLHMIDEGTEVEGNSWNQERSSYISPFLCEDDDISIPKTRNDVLPLPQPPSSPCFGNQQVDSVQQELSSTLPPPAIGTQSSSVGAIVLFKMTTCKLLHRNHPVMSDEKYTIHLAKRWLEGHQEKIERIYADLRKKGGSSLKITPKTIKKHLQDSFDIDIYAKCTDKEHKKFLKKKLDNLMKSIKLKEKAAAKQAIVALKEQSLNLPQKPAAKNKRSLQSNTSSEYHDAFKKPMSIATSTSSKKFHLNKMEIEETPSLPYIVKAACVIEPESTLISSGNSILIEEGTKNSTISEENRQQYFMTQLRKPSLLEGKMIKEEWESFIQLEIPQKRVEPAR